MKRIYLIVFLVSAALFQSYAQDDLMKQLESQSKPVREPVIATFKSTKIINMQTNETEKKRNLDFRVSHLFGNFGKESGGGAHNLYGLDQSADIRIAFHYGITNKLMAGVSRSKREENIEGELKYRLLEQTTDDKSPIAITLFGQSAMTAKQNDTTLHLYDEFAHRMSYCAQVIIARKFSPRFSFEVVPSYVHRNLVMTGDENDSYSVGAGFRYKFTMSASVIADYFYTFNRPELTKNDHYDPLGIGFEIETGGHVFAMMFTNASGILESDYIPNTTDTWSKGGYKFAFNISRTFKL
jgi:hypothetical protein